MFIKKNIIFLLFFLFISIVFFYIENKEIYVAQDLLETGFSSKIREIEFIVVGDVMLGRNVEVLMNERGKQYPFLGIANFLNSVPFVVANLEGSIVHNHTQTPSLTFKFSFASNTAKILKENNISFVSLANNHALDQEAVGYADTKRYLEAVGVDYFGHPVSVGNISVMRKEVEGQNLVFIGLNATWPYDEKEYEDLIKKEALSSDFIAVFVHWGEEYKLVSNDEQKSLAHMFIDSGASVVFGHHPHVVQEIETYKDRAIFYSLGNFIFDQYFSKDVKEGLAVKIILEEKKVKYELFPITSPRSQPSLMQEDERQYFLKNLGVRTHSSFRNQIEKGVIELSR